MNQPSSYICARAHSFRSWLSVFLAGCLLLSGFRRFEQVFYLAPLVLAFRRSGTAPVPRGPHIRAPLIPGAPLCFCSQPFRDRALLVGRYAMLYRCFTFIAETNIPENQQAGRRHFELIQERQGCIRILLGFRRIVQYELGITQFAIRSHQMKPAMGTRFRQFAPDQIGFQQQPQLLWRLVFSVQNLCEGLIPDGEPVPCSSPVKGSQFLGESDRLSVPFSSHVRISLAERVAHAYVGKRQIVGALNISAVPATEHLRDLKSLAGMD